MVMEKASHPVVSYGKALRMDGADYPTLRAQLSRRFVSLTVRSVASVAILKLAGYPIVSIIQALSRRDPSTPNLQTQDVAPEAKRKKGKKE